MTRIINIIFPGLLGVLCPTGMACLPGFQPGFEHLNEPWDLEEEFACTCSFWYHLLLGATKGNRTPSAKPHCTTDPQQGKPHEPLSSNPPHPRLCLYIHLLLLPATTALENASATSSRLHTALRPENPSLTTSIAAHRPTRPSAAALTSLRTGRCEGSTPKMRSRSFPCPSCHHLPAQRQAAREGRALAEKQPCLLPPALSSHPHCRPWRL